MKSKRALKVSLFFLFFLADCKSSSRKNMSAEENNHQSQSSAPLPVEEGGSRIESNPSRIEISDPNKGKTKHTNFRADVDRLVTYQEMKKIYDADPNRELHQKIGELKYHSVETLSREFDTLYSSVQNEILKKELRIQ